MIWARVAVVVLMCGGVVAAGEAVSGLNGKLAYSGGSMEGDTGQNGLGSFSFPITHNFGFQADGLYTDVSDREFYGAGAHLFWRDWDRGLLGIAGGTVHEDDLDSGLIGLEGECYLNRQAQEPHPASPGRRSPERRFPGTVRRGNLWSRVQQERQRIH